MVRGRYQGGHEHQPIQGRSRIGGQRMNMSEWAGSYNSEFSKALLTVEELALLKVGFDRPEMNLGPSDPPRTTYPAGNQWGGLRSNKRRR